MKKNIMLIALGIIMALLITTVIVVIVREDREGPNIQITLPENGEIIYKSGENGQELLSYAKAVDDVDGDVSDSLKIEDINITIDLTKATIIYVARDKSDNITRLKQVVTYLPSQEELDDLANLNSGGESEEVVDALNQKQEEAVSENLINIEVPVLVLSQKEVELEQGKVFNVNNYIKEIKDNKDDEYSLYRRVVVRGEYDMQKVGDYTITIFCTDSDENKSNVEEFVIHVTPSTAIVNTQEPVAEPIVEEVLPSAEVTSQEAIGEVVSANAVEVTPSVPVEVPVVIP